MMFFCKPLNYIFITSLSLLLFACSVESSNVGRGEVLTIDDSSSSDECTPNCDGKECGEDGCGGICGLCENRICNENDCMEGRCVNIPVNDQVLSCNGFALLYCSSGESEFKWCPEACMENGYNIAYGCGVEGAYEDNCNCGNIEESCTQSLEVCVSNSDIFGCDAETGFFYQVDCDGACKSIGHAGATGCSNDQCNCIDLDSNNNACLPAGADCESGVGVAFCCQGLSCVNNGYTSKCRESTPCRSQCLSPSGNVCCGGGNCSGDCVGNPCCN